MAIETLFPTANTNSNCTNPGDAYDNDIGSASYTTSAISNSNEVTKTWQSPGYTYSALDLKIISEATFTGLGTSTYCKLEYSLNNGSSWTTIYSVNTSREEQEDTVSLSPSQDLSQLQVKIYTTGTSILSTMRFDLVEVWTEGTIASGKSCGYIFG